MAEHEAKFELESHQIPLKMRDLDPILVDQMVGFTSIEGVARVVLGQLSFTPNSPQPVAVAAVALAGTKAAWRRIRNQIDDVLKAMDEEQAEISSPGPAKDVVETDE